jgi:hypothetical protein
MSSFLIPKFKYILLTGRVDERFLDAAKSAPDALFEILDCYEEECPFESERDYDHFLKKHMQFVGVDGVPYLEVSDEERHLMNFLKATSQYGLVFKADSFCQLGTVTQFIESLGYCGGGIENKLTNINEIRFEPAFSLLHITFDAYD